MLELWFNQHRDLPAARRFFTKAIERQGRPERTVIDGSQTNRDAIISCDMISRLHEQSHKSLNPIRIGEAST